MMKIQRELIFFQLGQAPLPLTLEDRVLQIARRDPGAVYRVA